VHTLLLAILDELWWCMWFYCLTLVLSLISMDLILRNLHTTHLSRAGSSK